MKKKNWLLTIAFAVLALTIVSTTVLGGTYAKFVSRVSGGAQAQAAGFLVTGTSSTSESTVLIAPGETFNVNAGITTYFSQVATEITLTNSVDAERNTGVFTDTNWAAIVAYYNEYVASDADHKVSPTLAVSNVIVVNGATTANTIAAAIYAAGYSETEADNVWASTYTTGSNILPAMKANVTTTLSLANINLSITWVTPKCLGTSSEVDNDEFDTFLGNCIAMMATTNSTSVTAATTNKTMTNDVPTTLTLTGTAAYQKSYVATALTITAQQYIAPAQGD